MKNKRATWGWIATGVLTLAAFAVDVGAAGAQGFSGSSGGGFSGSSGGGFSGSSGGGFSGSSGGGFSGSSGGGFTGSSSGSGFTGSSSGMGFIGTSSGTGFTGTSTGYSGTGSTGRTGSGTNQVVPQASDPLQPYYANPYKFGMTSTTGSGTGTGRSSSSGAFGTPLYGTTNSPTTSTTTSGTGSTANMSFNTVGQRRAPSFTTTIAYGTPFGFAPPTAAPASALQTKMTTVFQGTTMLPNTNLQIAVDGGGTVVLRGQVATESERRLAEGMVRLEPGVRNVRNLITIGAPKAAAAP